MTKISNLYGLTNYVTANSSGNVVIAAPTSGYALDVTGTGRFTGALTGTSITLSNSLNFTSIYGGNINGYDGTSLVPMSYSASQHQYYAGGTLKMTLLGNGNLLLGTTTDNGSKLQVTGTASFSGALNGTSATFSGAINLTGTANSFQVASIFRNANRVFFGGDTGGYFFQNSGNTATVLQIADSGAATFSSSVTAANFYVPSSNEIRFYNTNSTNWGTIKGSTDATNGYITLTGGSGNGMIIANTGNVGIGTTSPSATLHTEVNSSTWTAKIINTNTSTNNAGLLVKAGVNSGNEIILAQKANGTSVFLVDASGNVGIGTTSPGVKLTVFTSGQSFTSSTITYSAGSSQGFLLDNSAGTSQSGNAIWFANSGLYSAIASTRVDTGTWGTDLRFYTHPDAVTNQYDVTERMRITSGGNVLIGTSFAPAGNGLGIAIYKNDYPRITFRNSTTGDQASGGFQFYLNGNDFYQESPGNTIFANGGTERMRLTSGGFFKASNNGTYYGSTGAFHELRSDSGNSYSLVLQHTSSSLPYGMTIYYNNASPNSTNHEFIYAQDNSLSRFIVWSNGSVVNRTGSYGTISDIKFKENIVDASPKLGDIAKLKVRNFNLKGENTKQIGFIAQEFEEVFPNMVDVSTEKGTDGETYKSIKTSVLVPMLVKAVQELKAELDTATTRLQELENK